MPIYEYRCPQCGHELERMQKVSDPPPSPCPQCGAEGPLERLMSRSSFQLKGGGWYSDLYGSTKKDSTSKTESGGSSSGSTTGGASASGSAPGASTPSSTTASSSAGGASSTPGKPSAS